MLLNCGVGEDSWESLGLQEDQTSQSLRKSVLNIHWQDWCWSWNSNTLATWWEELTHCKDHDAGKDWRQEEKGMTDDEIFQWHHWLYGHEFEQAPGVGDGQGDLVCCSPWGCKELDTTEWLNWTELNCFVTHVDFSWRLVLSCLPSLCSLSWQTHPHPQLNYHVHTHEVPNLYFHLSPLVWPSDWYIQMPTGLVWKDVWKPTQTQLVPQTWSSCSLPYFSWLVYHSIQWYLEIFWYHLVPPSLWNFLLGGKSNFAYFFVYCLLPKTLGIHSLLSIFILTMLPSTSFLDYCSISSCTNIHSDLFC